MPTEDSYRIPSVSELTGDIKSVLESRFGNVMVEGEVSGAKKAASGHIYFTLKDDRAQLPCVIWRSVAQSKNIELAQGQQIVAGGDIQVYPPHGKYQLIVRLVQQAGIGALQKAFEELKTKLREEGLFDDTHKRPLPKFPQTIGVITSETGAAFHDISSTLEQRYPLARILLYHASVQGVNAAPELVRAINYFSEAQNVDVLIVGRGGGSLEDLWPFNEEAVARAIYECSVPTISAVGHEVDFSISDFVADARAATPTQAAVLAAPDINELRFYLDDLDRRLARHMTERVRRQSERVQRLLKTHALQAVLDKVGRMTDRVASLTDHLNHLREVEFLRRRETLQNLKHRLALQNPNEALEHGYVRVFQEGNWVKHREEFSPKEAFELHWKDGRSPIQPK